MAVESMSKRAVIFPVKESSPLSAAEEGDPPSENLFRYREKIVDHMAGALMLLFMESGIDGMSFKRVFDALERDLLIKALLVFNGHQQKTAGFLGLLPTTLAEKLKKHHISIEYTTNVAVGRTGENAELRVPRALEVRLPAQAGPDGDDTREFRIK